MIEKIIEIYWESPANWTYRIFGQSHRLMLSLRRSLSRIRVKFWEALRSGWTLGSTVSTVSSTPAISPKFDMETQWAHIQCSCDSFSVLLCFWPVWLQMPFECRARSERRDRMGMLQWKRHSRSVEKQFALHLVIWSSQREMKTARYHSSRSRFGLLLNRFWQIVTRCNK